MWDNGQIFSQIMGGVGGMALLVGVVTELTKNIGCLQKIPTDLQALVSGILLGLGAVFWRNSANSLAFSWYQLAGGLVQGIFAAFVAIYGWEKLDQLARRFHKSGSDENV